MNQNAEVVTISKVVSMSLVDKKQRQRAIELDKSFVVRAPAGSGKTELLVQRVLATLTTVERPSQCLVLTFTQKAVSELKDRIAHVFSKHAELLDETEKLKHRVLEHVQKNNWSLETFWHQIRVKTLDSLFIDLVKKYSQKDSFETSAIDLSPEVQSECIVDAFFKEYLIDNPCEQFVALCAFYDNSYTQLKNLLKELYLMREVWLINVLSSEDSEQDPFSLFKEQVIPLQSLIEDNKCLTEKIVSWLCVYLPDLQSIDFNNDSWANDLLLWRQLANLLVTKSGKWRQKYTKNQGFPVDKDLMPWHSKADKAEHLEAVFQLQEVLSDDRQVLTFLKLLQLWPTESTVTDLHKRWLSLLKQLIAFSTLYKKQHYLIDYTDVTLELWVLFNNSDVWPLIEADLESENTHLFLDECQDLSYVQFSILKKIIGICAYSPEKTFFVVGDPQQAIYHFRGSEVGVFQSFETLCIPGLDFEVVKLSSNFRSISSLVSFYNQWTQSVFSQRSLPFLGIDKALKAHSVQPDKGGFLSANHYRTVETEARSIALSIKNVIKNDNTTTLAVLARDRKSLKPVMKELQAFKVPFQTSGIYHLLDVEMFFDCYCLIRVILAGENKSFWLSALRSHFLGASMYDIQQFYTADKEHFFEKTEGATFSPIFEKNFQHLLTHYRSFEPYLQREKVGFWLKNFFIAYGYMNYLKASDKNSWLLLLAPFEKIHHVREIVWPLIEQQLSRTPLINAQQAQVSVMTIHQAKGLEFDAVYLPNLSAPLPNMKAKLLHSIKTSKHHLWSVNPPGELQCQSFNFCQALSSLHQKNEAIRLLYVGLTRAKKSLYLSANAQKSYGHNFRQYLDDFIPFNDSSADFDKPEELVLKEKRFVLPQSHQSHTLNWQKFRFNQDRLESCSQKVYQRQLKVIGLVWHKILQVTQRWPIDQKLLTKEALVNLFYSFGAQEEDIAPLFQNFGQIFQKINKSKNACYIYNPEHLRHESEFPLSVSIKGKLVKKVVDKFIIDKDGNLVVFEIKSAARQDLDAELLRTYIKQLRSYQSYISILYKKPCQAYFWFLKSDELILAEQAQQSVPH